MSDSETSKPRSNKSKRRSLLKWIKRSLWIAAALGLLAMIVVAFLPKPVLVDVVEVERGALRVTVDEDGRSLSDLMRGADTNLYQAKQAGRDKVILRRAA